MTAATQHQQQLDPERVGKLAAQAAALAGADLAYQLAVSQESLFAAVERIRQQDESIAEKDSQLAERDGELARLHQAEQRLQTRIRDLESGASTAAAAPTGDVPDTLTPPQLP